MNQLSVTPQGLRHRRASAAAVGSVEGKDGFEVAVTPAAGLDDIPQGFAAPVFLQDEARILESVGFLQDTNSKSLRLAPLWIWPNVVAAPAVDSIDALTTPKNSRLLCRVSYRLQSAQFQTPDASPTVGWSRAIASVSVTFQWIAKGSHRPSNIIFPGTNTDSLPPGGSLVWYFDIGQTDDEATFTPDSSGPFRNMLIPPL